MLRKGKKLDDDENAVDCSESGVTESEEYVDIDLTAPKTYERYYSSYSKREFGIDIDSYLDDKRFILKIRRGFTIIGVVLAIFSIYQTLYAVSDASKQGELLAFRPCDPLLAPSSELLQSLLDARKKVSYYCSTQNQRSSQACACCVKDKCWRDVHIISNASLDPSEIVDRVDGVKYQRHIPKSMQVCYHIESHLDLDACEKVEGVRVNAILRAIEKLKGWNPSGTIVVH